MNRAHIVLRLILMCEKRVRQWINGLNPCSQHVPDVHARMAAVRRLQKSLMHMRVCSARVAIMLTVDLFRGNREVTVKHIEPR